jgi:hypothetical protein
MEVGSWQSLDAIRWKSDGISVEGPRTAVLNGCNLASTCEGGAGRSKGPRAEAELAGEAARHVGLVGEAGGDGCGRQG